MTGQDGGVSGNFYGQYIFVAGLHRTGTSLLARMIGSHHDIAQIEGAPVPENEGCYLQGAIPHTARHGIPGHFATDPAQHLIEECRFDTLATRERLNADWAAWFDPEKNWRLEKSPVNLTRMRLYQQLFPLAHFVVILRHPEAMAAALAKWSDQSAHELIDYALDAYEIALGDIQFLHRVYVLRYEDLVTQPDELLSSLFAWLGIAAVGAETEVRDGNADYRGAWTMSGEQGERAKTFGYGQALTTEPMASRISHPLRANREAAHSLLNRAITP